MSIGSSGDIKTEPIVYANKRLNSGRLSYQEGGIS